MLAYFLDICFLFFLCEIQEQAAGICFWEAKNKLSLPNIGQSNCAPPPVCSDFVRLVRFTLG